MLVALNFHYVRPTYDEPYPGIHGITPGELLRQIELLEGRGRFVTPAEVRRAVALKEPFEELSFLVTFDDGLREQYDNAVSLLERRGISALFFVNTAPIHERRVATVHKIHLVRAHTEPSWCIERFAAGGGALDGIPAERIRNAYPYDDEDQARLKYLLNHVLDSVDGDRIVGEAFLARFGPEEASIAEGLYMDVDQLRELARRSLLGSHGHRHIPLGRTSAASQAEQIKMSQDLLEAWTGSRPFSFSFPFGTREACHLADPSILRHAGIAFAFTMERSGNRRLSNPLHLARFDCNDLPGGRNPMFEIDDLPDRIPDRSWPLSEDSS
jgi:peptidoglycan/xylan/chitin deacetylase (PgdA/CDA1 family)